MKVGTGALPSGREFLALTSVLKGLIDPSLQARDLLRVLKEEDLGEVFHVGLTTWCSAASNRPSEVRKVDRPLQHHVSPQPRALGRNTAVVAHDRQRWR